MNASRQINELHQVTLDIDEYERWERIFYPSPGRIQISPILTRIPRGPAQLSIVIDAPDMPGTRIYLGPNEMGTDTIEAVQMETGIYELTLSYTPPADAPDPDRRRSRLQLTLPPEIHITERYSWNGTAFELMERTEGPLVPPPDTP